MANQVRAEPIAAARHDHRRVAVATMNELHYPATSFEAIAIDEKSTVLALAGGGSPSTWQADRLAG